MARAPTTLATFITFTELADTPPAPPPEMALRLRDSTGAYSADATFFAAADDCEETCPITMEPLGTPALEGQLFDGAPEINAVRLACGHGCNGMALVYHWMRNHMRCPLCRKGGDFQLAASNFTGGWAAEWERSTREIAKREQLDALRHEEELLRRLLHESLLPDDTDFDMHVVIDVLSLGGPFDAAEPLVMHDIHTVVYFYTADDDDPPRVLHSETVAMFFRDESLASSQSTTRNLCRALSTFHPSHIRLTSFGVQLGGSIRVLASSPLVPMDRLRGGAHVTTEDLDSGGVYRVQGTPGAVPGIGSVCLELPPRVRLIQLT
jgi:hypothetical protein